MKLSIISSLLVSATAFSPASTGSSKTTLSASKADLESMAEKLNPIVKFYDPLNLADANFWGFGNEATIGFLRQSEIKHGRIAMFAFVGYIVQSNGKIHPVNNFRRPLNDPDDTLRPDSLTLLSQLIKLVHFPWPQTLAGAAHPSVDLSPEAQWDAVPVGAKWQIFAVISMLELWDEVRGIWYMGVKFLLLELSKTHHIHFTFKSVEVVESCLTTQRDVSLESILPSHLSVRQFTQFSTFTTQPALTR